VTSIGRGQSTSGSSTTRSGITYNTAHDIALPGSEGSKLPFLMYPNGETSGKRLDSLDPDAFRYTITARELTA
jgi:hypothetical protein